MPVPSPRLGAYVCAALVALCASALAQVPPPPLPPDAAAAACLCMKQSLADASADMAAKTGALDALRADLQRLDGELAGDRAHMEVGDAQAVARFRQRLQERDTLFHRSTGEAFIAAQQATERYNTAVADYNNQCAGRPLPPPPSGPLPCAMR